MTKRRASRKKPTGENKSLGQSLTNARQKALHRRKGNRDEDLDNVALLPSTEAKVNVDSIVEESGLEEFLAKAELADAQFTANREDVRILTESAQTSVVLSKAEVSFNAALQAAETHRLKIPRRPPQEEWNSAEELLALEKSNFLNWRKNIAELQEGNGLVLTPFERNLELWRQLWRVVERSDIVVQIVDSRNPLLFYSRDLELYVRESGIAKQHLLMVNKADLLTEEQMRMWREYFVKNNMQAIFWSAVDSSAIKDETESDDRQKMPDGEDEDGQKMRDEDEEDRQKMRDEDEDRQKMPDEEDEDRQKMRDEEDEDDHSETENDQEEEDNAGSSSGWSTESDVEEDHLLEHAYQNNNAVVIDDAPYANTPQSLIDILKQIGHAGNGIRPITVGMIGYPNVGKSSTINRLIGHKKVPVSAVPGRTRHLQTIILDSQLTLCDCPGLVIPSFAFSRNEMILNGKFVLMERIEFFFGILSVDHMRDYYGPINLLLTRLPIRYLEATYSVMLPSKEGEQATPSAHQFLTAVAFMRGFMSSAGIPDCSRAARMIDVISGRLKWIAAPPGTDQVDFDEYPIVNQAPNTNAAIFEQMSRRHLIDSAVSKGKAVDAQFFENTRRGYHCQQRVGNAILAQGDKKHGNKNKREKLRRIYGSNDA